MYLHLTNAESKLIGINPKTPKFDDNYAFWLLSFILCILQQQQQKTGYLKKSPAVWDYFPLAETRNKQKRSDFLTGLISNAVN